MDFTKLIEIYSFIGPIITLIAGWWANRAYEKYKKRTEEVNVTGTEHDTVKRISQSSIETIERLNIFSEQLSEKMLEQRSAFSDAIAKLEVEIENLRKLNSELRDQNSQLVEMNKKLQKVIDAHDIENRTNKN